jgi:transposase
MEAGVYSIWVSEQLKEYGHEVIVANVTELHSISRNDSKSDRTDAEKLARYADSIQGYCVRSPSDSRAAAGTDHDSEHEMFLLVFS